MNCNGKPRAKPGELKELLTELKIGDTIPCEDGTERNKYYVMARRYGIRLRRVGKTMVRVA